MRKINKNEKKRKVKQTMNSNIVNKFYDLLNVETNNPNDIQEYPKVLRFGEIPQIKSKIERTETFENYFKLKLYDNTGKKKNEGHFYPHNDDEDNLYIIMYIRNDEQPQKYNISIDNFRKLLYSRCLPTGVIPYLIPLAQEQQFDIDTPADF